MLYCAICCVLASVGLFLVIFSPRIYVQWLLPCWRPLPWLFVLFCSLCLRLSLQGVEYPGRGSVVFDHRVFFVSISLFARATPSVLSTALVVTSTRYFTGGQWNILCMVPSSSCKHVSQSFTYGVSVSDLMFLILCNIFSSMKFFVSVNSAVCLLQSAKDLLLVHHLHLLVASGCFTVVFFQNLGCFLLCLLVCFAVFSALFYWFLYRASLAVILFSPSGVDCVYRIFSCLCLLFF
jgi:hypothetical protein